MDNPTGMIGRAVSTAITIAGVLLLLLGLCCLPLVHPFLCYIPNAFGFIVLWFSTIPANALLLASCPYALIGHLDPPMLSWLGVTVVYFLPGTALVVTGVAASMSSR